MPGAGRVAADEADAVEGFAVAVVVVVEGRNPSPGVPTTAAAKRWVGASRAWAAMAVRSRLPLRLWSRSTSWRARMSASSAVTVSCSRVWSTMPSCRDRPWSRLKVTSRTSAPYGVVWESFWVIFKVLLCSVLVFVLLGALGIGLRRRRGR